MFTLASITFVRNIKSMFKNTQKLLVLIAFLAFCHITRGQTTTVSQDSKFERLLNEKRKINSGVVSNSTYKIQIFSGSSEDSKKNLMAFKKEFKNYDGTIIFNTPNYKVLIGNFKTRIEAEHDLNIIKKTYSNALLIKPNR